MAEKPAEAIYYALGGNLSTIDGMDLLFRQRKISYLLTNWQGKILQSLNLHKY